MPDCTLSFVVRVCSPEHYDLSLVQHFMNVLWHGYVDHIFLGDYKKALSLCTVASFKNAVSLNFWVQNMLKQSKQYFILSSNVGNFVIILSYLISR